MREEIKENYGSKIRELRIKNGLTQSAVAEAIGVTPGYISHVENNRTAMSLRVLIFYAKTLGVSLDSLVGQIEPAYKLSALDNELIEEISKMRDTEKVALLQTMQIWKQVNYEYKLKR